MAPNGTAWTSLLHGEEQQRALAEVHRIADDLRSIHIADASLSGGAAGVALFFAYLAEATGEGPDADAAVTFLETALEHGPGGETGAALHGGYTGVAWTLAHLDGWLVDVGEHDPNEAMDDALIALLRSSAVDNHDLISGVAGLGVYALERLPRPSAREAMASIVAELARLAVQDDETVGWFTSPGLLPRWQLERCPSGYWDLGMAHGLPGVIAFLSHARSEADAPVDVDRLLAGALAWLLERERPAGSPSRFDAWIAPDGERCPARTAWCYGDPGVAAALLAAGRRKEAVDVGLAAATRPPDDCGVVDAGLCHGAGGLGHVFNRLYQATGEEAFATASRSWLRQALQLPADELGFLEGEAGVGLALLAAATDIEPAWDRVLLLSGHG